MLLYYVVERVCSPSYKHGAREHVNTAEAQDRKEQAVGPVQRMDVAVLSNIFGGFTNEDETIRKAAELGFNEAVAADPGAVLVVIFQLLSSAEVAVERKISGAVAIRTIFRPLLLGHKENAWTKLTPDVKAGFKTELFRLLESEPSGSVKRVLGEVCGEVGGTLHSLGEWAELPSLAGNLATSTDDSNSTIGLNVLTHLIPYLAESLGKSIDPFFKLISQRFASGSTANKVAAVKTLAKVVACLDRSSWKPFQAVMPAIMDVLKVTIAGADGVEADVDLASELLQALVDMGETDTDIFKPQLSTVLDTMLVIAGSDETTEDIRRMAVEFLLTVVESKPKMCLKVNQFLEKMLACLFQLLECIKEDWETFDKTNLSSKLEGGSTMNEESTLFNMGEGGIDRLTSAVDGEIVMPVLFPLVGLYISKPDWYSKFAGIMAISQTVEYLPEDELETQVPEIVKLLLGQLSAEDSRVRFAACQALGQLALDQQPLVQRCCADTVLPALIATVNDSSARVQAHAISAFINFAEEVTIPDLAPHVDGFMETLLSRLRPEWTAPRETGENDELTLARLKLIREQSITAIAVIAGVIESQFLKYYSVVVPLTMYIIENATSKSESTLRGKAIECLSIIAYAVGLETFKNDIDVTMSALISLIQQDRDSDDTVKDYVHEATRRMVKVMGKESAKFLPQLVPYLYQTLQYQVEEVADELKEGYTLVSLDRDGEQGGFKSVRTSEVDNLEKSLKLVETVVEVLGELYGPYVEATIEKIMPIMNVDFSDAARRCALVTVAELLRAARGALDARATNPELCAELTIEKITQWLKTSLIMLSARVSEDEYDVEEMTADVSGLARCLGAAGPDVLNAEQVLDICNKVLNFMKQSSDRRRKLADAKRDPDLDEEDLGNLEDEEEREQIFRSTLLNSFSSLMKHHSKLFLQVGGSTCVEFIRVNLNSSQAPDRALALYVCTDILEQLKEEGEPLWPEFVERMIISVTDNDLDVRQAACYGCTFLPKYPKISNEVISSAVQRLNQVVMAPKSQVKDNKIVTDNAISALWRCVIERPAVFADQKQKEIDLLMEKLPIRVDGDEAVVVHEELLNILVTDVPEFWGENRANLPHILRIVSQIYQTDMVLKSTDVLIKRLVNERIGKDTISQTVGQMKMSAADQKSLQRIMLE